MYYTGFLPASSSLRKMQWAANVLLKCCPDSVVGGVCHETRGAVQLGVSEECDISKNFLKAERASSVHSMWADLSLGCVSSWLRGCMMAAHEGKKRR